MGRVITISDKRLISLCSFANKIISRVVHGIMAQVLPKIISNIQVGFVRGKSITENALLAQEISGILT